MKNEILSIHNIPVDVRTIKVEGTEYYEVYSGITVGEMFSDWRDIDRYKHKLRLDIAKAMQHITI